MQNKFRKPLPFEAHIVVKRVSAKDTVELQ